MTDTDPTSEARLFDASAVAKGIREHRALRRSEVDEARARLAAIEGLDVEMTRRAQEAHIRHTARKQEAADYAQAQADRNAAMPVEELAARIAARLRRRRY